jgi:hypothetical protein
VARFHQEAEQAVSIVFIRRCGKAWASGRNCKHAKQIGVPNPIVSVDYHPNMRGQITVKSAVPKESGHDLTKSLPGPHCAARLDEKIAQLHDLFRIAYGHICKL